jgi:RimJ/RimL family protein N-acetyltransferase
MKVNADYNPNLKSSPSPKELIFRQAESQDRICISKLMHERNPTLNEDDVLRKTDREISLTASDPKYRLFVCEIENKVIGLCRYFHSTGLSAEKILYPGPSGYYCMGTIVKPEWRRQGVARFLFKHRLDDLKKSGALSVYSTVDSENLASIRMHETFGFKEKDRAPGLLNLKFESGEGILYQLNL